ncbi:MAG: MBL fold metallo-hydrolase [Bacteroidota bacterium]|nr:MBL fold metallo-hydrolase [Bacteroidota bacterium]
MFKKIKIIIFAFLLFSLSGCGLVFIGFENVGNTIFSSAKDADIKIKDPVKENVKLSAYWIGHSSTLLQIYDRIFLLDPVFNDVISGVMLRRETAAIDFNSLSKLDMILVSHAHMDHLSITTLSDIEDKFPGAKLIFPKGTEEFMPDYDFEFIRMKTGNSSKKNYIGETKIIDSVKITTVYALHFGGRFGIDSYLWQMPGCTGYIIQYKDVTVFYAGDTSYDEKAFKAIGEKFNIDLAIIPIGPCKDCEEIANFSHVASYGALLMFDDLKSKYMLPVHYGALEYRRDPDYPILVLKELIDKRDNSVSLAGSKNMYKERVIIIGEGEQYVFENLE